MRWPASPPAPAARSGVLVDLGVGRRRTGCASSEAALAVARRIAGSNSLAFGGVQAYAGHLQHIADLGRAPPPGRARGRHGRARSSTGLAADRIPVPRVSGAGTGTHAIDAAGGLFSELQCGSYIFLDVDYARVALRDDEPQPFAPALFVRTAVISANAARSRHDRRRPQGVRDRRPAAADPARRARGRGILLLRRRARPGRARGRAAPPAGRQRARVPDPALRPDRQPLQRLPRGPGRHADRHLADRRPRRDLRAPSRHRLARVRRSTAARRRSRTRLGFWSDDFAGPRRDLTSWRYAGAAHADGLPVPATGSQAVVPLWPPADRAHGERFKLLSFLGADTP